MEKESKDANNQTNRIRLMLVPIMGEKYRGIPHSIGYNVETDRVEIQVSNSSPIELGPKEWFMEDQQLRDLIVAKLHNVIRTNLPERSAP
jgi:hypothetical protein